MTRISENKNKNGQKYVLNPKKIEFFFRGSTISITSAASSLRVYAGTIVLEGIGNSWASNALKPLLMFKSQVPTQNRYVAKNRRLIF